jgi:NAD(P)-dependent dehydrogenase (short-subunit alcohol dehydrogenase family)
MNTSRLSSSKTFIVTGAGSGIGFKTAEYLYSKGANVVAVDRDVSRLSLIEKHTSSENRFEEFQADVSSEPDVKSYVDFTVQKFGAIDGFHNNAGVLGPVASIVDTKEQDLDLVLGINVLGSFFGIKHVLRQMMSQQHGSIVNMGSVASFHAYENIGSYVASKHAIVGLTKNAALEAAPYGIRVNSVHPGSIDTPMQRAHELGESIPEEDQVADIALGRYGTPLEVAKLVYFLLSDDSSYITGSTINIDGGMHL